MPTSATSRPGTELLRLPMSLSIMHMKKLQGGEFSRLSEFLYPHSLMANRRFDDFHGTLDPNIWLATGNAGATAFAGRANDAEGSMIRGSTGATSGEGTQLTFGTSSLSRYWNGNQNCLMEVRFQIDVVTSLRFEIGFADVRTTRTEAVITNVDTPASGNGAADLAVVHMDTGKTLTTMAFLTDGSTAGMNTTRTNLGTRSPVAGNWMTVRVGIIQNSAFCQVYNSDDPQAPALLEEAYHGDVTASQVAGATMLEAYALFETLTTVARVVDIDYFLLLQDR